MGKKIKKYLYTLSGMALKHDSFVLRVSSTVLNVKVLC